MGRAPREPTCVEALILDMEWPDDPFVCQAIKQQIEWIRLVVSVSGRAVAATVDGDYAAAATEFGRCERLVLMIMESKRWRRIHEQGEASDG